MVAKATTAMVSMEAKTATVALETEVMLQKAQELGFSKNGEMFSGGWSLKEDLNAVFKRKF